MKKIAAFIFAALFAVEVWAYYGSETVDGTTWYYNRISDGNGGYNAEITYRDNTHANTYSGNLTIPSSLGGYKVTSIGQGAFYICQSLTSVTIPNSVTTIGWYAFQFCSSLKSVTIPDSVTTIGASAFSNCSSLKSVTIPDSVTTIGSLAFDCCGSLTSFIVGENNPSFKAIDGLLCSEDGTKVIAGINGDVSIPDGVTTIGSCAFYGCSSLTSVTIPDSVTEIGVDAFEYCSSLKSVTIPDSVTTIRVGAFYNCSSLKSVTIPDSVTTIGSRAFNCCGSLTSFIVGENNPSFKAIDGLLCSEDGTKVIAGINGDVSIPDGVTTIGSYAFYGYSSLTTVTIPNSVTEIGDSAFLECDALTTVYVDDGDTTRVKELMRGKEVDVDTLAFVEVEPPKPDGGPYKETVDGVEYTFFISDGKATIGTEQSYVAAISTDTSGALAIPSILGGCPVISIGKYAFEGCELITAATIPMGVMTIGSYAFAGDFRIAEISIPDTITSIEYWAFAHCSKLVQVDIPENVSEIGSNAFYYCSSIRSVDIPSNVETVGASAFHGCENLESVVLNEGLQSIGWKAFNRCKIREIVIPASVRSIGSGVVGDCDQLTSIIVNSDNPYYDSRDNCNAIVETESNKIVAACGTTVIPKTVVGLLDGAFDCCNSLTHIEIPARFVDIQAGAFSTCQNLQSIVVDPQNPKYDSRNDCNAIIETASNTLVEGCKGTIIPSFIKHIGEKAFYYGKSPSVVELPEGLVSIGDDAFCGGKFKSINFPNSLKSIGDAAFNGCNELRRVVLPDSVTEISGNSTFAHCEKLHSVRLSPSVKVLPGGMFWQCYGLTNVNIPEGVEELAGHYNIGVFEQCSALQSLVIPSSVTELFRLTFYDSNTRNIFFEGNAPYVSTDLKEVPSDCIAYVKRESTGWGVDIPGTWKGIAIEYMPTCPPASWSRSFEGPQIWKGGGTSGAKDDDVKIVNLPRVGAESNGGFIVGAPGYPKGPYYDKYAFALEEDWSVALLAKLSSTPNGVLWSFGSSSGDGKGLALVQKSKTEVALVNWVKGGTNIELLSATVTKGFHTYVVTYASESKTFALYVDNEAPVNATINDHIYLDDSGHQFGAVHGGGVLETATNAIIDDAAYWTGLTLTSDQVAEVVSAVGELLPVGDVATEIVDNLEWTYCVDEDGVKIGTGQETAAITETTSGDVVIPAELGGKPVIGISESAFLGCGLITSIKIPSSVAQIDEDSFADCDALTTVYVETGDAPRIKALMQESGVNIENLSFVEESNAVRMLCYLPLDGNANNLGMIDEAKISADDNVSYVTSHKFGSGAYKADAGSIVIADEESGIADFENGWAISLWFHGNSMGNWKDIFGFQVGNYVYKLESCNGAYFQIYNLSNTANASGSWTTNGGLGSQISASRNDWHHLLIQANTTKTGFDIYLDGEYNQGYVKAGGALWGGDEYLAALTKVVIGTKGIHDYSNTSHSGNDGRSSTALVDDIAIYGGRLSLSQIRELAANTPKDFDGADIVTLPVATYSHDFNGGMTTPSSVLGGAIIPNRGDTFGSFTHVIREGEPNGAGAIPSTASGKNGQYGSTELVDDEADWTIAMVAKAANVANGTFWSVGSNCYINGQTGLALVLTDATHVSLVRWQKGGDGNETLLTAEVVDATEEFHLYTVAYNHATEVYTLFVDATEAASFTGARTFTTNGYQIGAVHGGAASVGLAVANGFVLDDFAVWKDFAAEEAHVKKIVAKYTPVIAVGSYAFDWPEGETTWRNDIGFTVGSATGIKPCAGDTVRFATGETITFASGAVIPSGIEFIIDSGTLKLASGTPSKVTVSAGATLDVAGTPDREFAIVLNGGTLTNSGANIGVSKKQTSAIELTADSIIDSDHDFGSVGGGWGRITCKLNGHKLTKRGSGTFIFSNTSFSGGGTINVEKGVVELDKGYEFPSGTTLNITGSTEGVFSVAQAGTQSGAVNLSDNPTVRLKITSIPNFVKNATGWTGKLLIAANISGLTSIGANTALYGNASEIEIVSGASCTGYFPKSARTSKLTINGAFTVNDGYSGENQAATVSELAGSGTIVDGIAANNKGATPIVKVEKYANWNGTIQEATNKKLTIEFLQPTLPGVEGDDDVEVTGDAESGFIVKPSTETTEVVITIPEGVAAEKVTVEVSPSVETVKANGAAIKVVKGAADITEFLDIPAAVDGVVNLGAAVVKEEVVKEALDPEKGAEIELSSEEPTLTTTATKPGLTYTLVEGTTLESMADGDSTVGDGQPWSPNITIKGGNSGFYTIKVTK